MRVHLFSMSIFFTIGTANSYPQTDPDGCKRYRRDYE